MCLRGYPDASRFYKDERGGTILIMRVRLCEIDGAVFDAGMTIEFNLLTIHTIGSL